MRIGVWLGSRIVKETGGGASYYSRLVQMIDNYQFSENVEICFLSFLPQKGLVKDVVSISQLPSFLYRLSKNDSFITRVIFWFDKLLLQKRGLKKVLASYKIKAVYYLNQAYCFDPSFPFVATNWDIGHRSTFPFPELIEKGSFEYRDKFYDKILPKALMIICESETGKREIEQYTRIGGHKIRVMPMFAGGVAQCKLSMEETEAILTQLGLIRFRYFFYPAQFWAHKNHIGILKAFHQFVQEDQTMKLVFTGSDKGNLQYIKRKVEEYGLNEYVHFMGFVPNETLSVLYRYAGCLIMASHFGPTNMPPIEAMEAGCPVICSDLGGHREILDDSAIYFDSFDSNSIYLSMKMMMNEREKYVKKINERRDKTIFNDKEAIRLLDRILQEVVLIRDNWD